MLDTRKMYCLLLTFSINLGCSSHYIDEMNRQASSDSQAGPSTVSSREADDEHNSMQPMYDKIEDFLQRNNTHSTSENNRVHKGSPVNNQMIQTIIDNIGKPINIQPLPNDYKCFLNKYGSIYGPGFEIYGPYQSDKGSETDTLELIQNGFIDFCKKNIKKPKGVKPYWLIAKIGESNRYYINLSKSGNNHIYSMDRNGSCVPFAKDFSEFLDKFFQICQSTGEDSD